MAKYRKKPVEIEATQFWGSGDHVAVEVSFGVPGSEPAYCVLSKQGYVNVNPGDWIIAEMDGSGHYPCAPDIFAATYDAV